MLRVEVLKIKLLIADDQKLIRESLKLMIEKNSEMNVVASASDGKEAYELCCRYKPDLVLMDIFMPEYNGLEATKLIKVKFPNVKILVLTSSNDLSDAYEALKNGADGYILKDIDVNQLILSIQSTLAGLGIIHQEILKTVSENIHDKSSFSNKSIETDGLNTILTERHLTIIRMLVDGYTNKQIGETLYIAEGTVKNIITEIIVKLQLKDRTQLAVFAIKNNLI